MSSTESDSESARDFPRSVEEEEKTENGNSHEENGNFMEENGPSSRRSPGRASKSASLFSLAFPISRVRKLVKSEGEIQWVGVEAGFLIAKAADGLSIKDLCQDSIKLKIEGLGEQELFLEKFVEDAFDRMQDKKRACVAYSDLSSHVVGTERLEFLADFVPEKMLVSSILPGKAMVEK